MTTMLKGLKYFYRIEGQDLLTSAAEWFEGILKESTQKNKIFLIKRLCLTHTHTLTQVCFGVYFCCLFVFVFIDCSLWEFSSLPLPDTEKKGEFLFEQKKSCFMYIHINQLKLLQLHYCIFVY